ncbi:MAG: hypothetical protein ACI9XJ_001288 [Marivirga sp.]|jgi:hypothetical protein
MKKIKLIIGLILFACICSSGYSQKSLIQPDISCSSTTEFANFIVESFLTRADRTSLRTESGTTNESISQISVVSNEQECTKISGFVLNKTKYRNIHDSMSNDRQIYSYKTNNYYYVFWSAKPAFADRVKTGPRQIFLVIKKDLSQIFEYYL